MFKAPLALKTSKPTPGQRHAVMCTVTKTHEDFYCLEKVAMKDVGKTILLCTPESGVKRKYTIGSYVMVP